MRNPKIDNRHIEAYKTFNSMMDELDTKKDIIGEDARSAIADAILEQWQNLETEIWNAYGIDIYTFEEMTDLQLPDPLASLC